MKLMSTLLVASMLLAMAAPAEARHNKRTWVRANNHYARSMMRRSPGIQALKQQRAQQYIQQQQYMANLEAQRQGLNNNYGYFNNPYVNNPYNPYLQQYNPYTGFYTNGSYGSRILNSIFR